MGSEMCIRDSVGDQWSCRIILPHSYQAEDGIVVDVEATGPTKQQAESDAGCQAFAVLCSRADHLHEVLFRPTHYNVERATLVNDIGRILNVEAAIQPLAVPEKKNKAGLVAAGGSLDNVPPSDLEKAEALIRLCLRAHNGAFDPSRISHLSLIHI